MGGPLVKLVKLALRLFQMSYWHNRGFIYTHVYYYYCAKHVINTIDKKIRYDV